MVPPPSPRWRGWNASVRNRWRPRAPALEPLECVKGAPDAKDGRETILSLTPACRELIRTGRAARQDWLLRAIQSKLSAEEQAQLAFSLLLLNRLVDN